MSEHAPSTVVTDAADRLLDEAKRAAAYDSKQFAEDIRLVARAAKFGAPSSEAGARNEDTWPIYQTVVGKVLGGVPIEQARRERTLAEMPGEAQPAFTVEAMAMKLQEAIDYHDNQSAMADAMDCVGPAKFHDKQIALLRGAFAALHEQEARDSLRYERPADLTEAKAAEELLRHNWFGDLGRIPLGKVVEFMQSFAEASVRRTLAEMPPASESRLRKALEEIVAVASGEKQVANDDTEGMSWIDKFGRRTLAEMPPAAPVDWMDATLEALKTGGQPGGGDRAMATAANEGRNWKGVLWRDSIKMRNLAEEIALHFAHDCEDSMCGEDADASNCEVAWIEDKLTDFLDEQAASAPLVDIPRCMERSEECGQCELREGHEGQHLAGYLVWGEREARPPAKEPLGKQPEGQG